MRYVFSPRPRANLFAVFFLCFVVQEDLRLPDSALALPFTFGDRRAKAGPGMLDRQSAKERWKWIH
jgi:hypothetical protein